MGEGGSKEKEVEGDPKVPGVHWFRVGRVLGKGAFGKVIAVTKKDTRKNYACKLLDKVQVIEKNSFKSVLLERELLSTLECPFIVNLRLAYQTETDLCMVVDLMAGGDLRFHLGKEHFFDEERAKFYAACILLALEYIHGQRVLHRDIKPDNLLLDENGYCHLTDFNISYRFTDEKPTTVGFAGTKPYMAPEVWRKDPYTFEPDYWSLGITLYEMLCSRVPFAPEAFVEDPDGSVLKKLILEENPKFPKRLSKDCISFVAQLLHKDKNHRLKLPAAKSHPWFANFDWAKLSTQSLEKLPFEPKKNRANVAGIHDIEEQFGAKKKFRPLTPEELQSFEAWNWTREGAFDLTPEEAAGLAGKTGGTSGDLPKLERSASNISSSSEHSKSSQGRKSEPKDAKQNAPSKAEKK
jgi:serine/threonine kinase 32